MFDFLPPCAVLPLEAAGLGFDGVHAGGAVVAAPIRLVVSSWVAAGNPVDLPPVPK